MPAKYTMLEFYSGIGGMHYAARLADWDVEILKAFDINTIVNEVYERNFGKNIVVQKDIEAHSLMFYDDLAADIWTMSPPCQPYTRLGKRAGSTDARAKSLLYLMNILPMMKNKPNMILLENVKGFEESDTYNILLSQLSGAGYTYQQFLLTPPQLGIPNSRLRFYLLAKLAPLKFAYESMTTILAYIPFSSITQNSTEEAESRQLQARNLKSFLVDKEEAPEDVFGIPEQVLIKYGRLFDIVKPSSRQSCCFTKGYTRFVEATGSILQMAEDLDTHSTFETFMRLSITTELTSIHTHVKGLRSLHLRYFTPREIANLLCFPSDFGFPENINLKQQYRMLGNSVNVAVVAELMQYLLKEPMGTKPSGNGSFN